MNKILFYILLCLLFYIIKYKSEKFINNQNKWKKYRLGDILPMEKLEIPDKNGLSYLDKVSLNYPNSIADKYLKLVKNTKKAGNLEILNKIVLSENYPKPDKKEIILHLRLGDVIFLDKNNNLKFTKLPRKNKTYAILPSELEKCLNILKNKK